MDTLTGSVERITYYNPENGYSVVRLRPDRRRAAFPAHGVNRDGLITIVGNLPELTPGEYLKLQGNYTNHPKHGYQFQVEICEQTLPATVDAIRRYLGSGLVRGIGPKFADRIVSAFGEDTLDIIENDPERLRTVPDIGPKRTAQIKTAWREQKQIKDIMLFLHGHGISTNLAIKIYKTYAAEALQIVQTDPYRLARDIFGVGFKTADKIAQSLGLTADHPSRLEAGVVYTLNQMTDDGHTYTPQPDLIQKAAELLDVNPDLIPPAIGRLAQDDRVHPDLLPLGDDLQTQPGRVAETQAPFNTGVSTETHAVYLTPLYYGEIGVARRLAALAHTLPSRLSDIPPALISLDPSLSLEQQTAIKTALTHPVSVLTGGPGTGKTTALKFLISILQSQNKRFALCAPTGRAAKRLSEATGHPAATIHRMLDYSPTRGFTQNEENPLTIDLLVVDEASMLDLILANSLLKALEPGTHLLLVGDVDQLPSVGAGDVLRDVIASGIAPVTRLNTIFRQAAESYIISNAHRINRGVFPEFPPALETEKRGGGEKGKRKAGDFFLFTAEDAESAGDWTLNVVTERIPARFGFDPVRDIQVLAPMYRGPAGVRALNDRLQAALNPPTPLKPEKALFGQMFRVGDKVMQTQNDYDKEVFNGDIGQVTAMDALNHTLTINFEGRNILFDWMECDQITLAYCVSVHKCVTEDTFLFTEGGILPIGSLWPARGGVRFRQVDVSVMSKDGWSKTSQIFKGGEEAIISIETRFGFQLSGSYRHPILVYEPASGELVWKKFPDIKVEDWVPIQRGQNAFPNTQFCTSAFNIPQKTQHIRAPCKIPPSVDAQLGAFLGYLVGDGSCTARKDGDIRFTNSDTQLVKHFQALLFESFGLKMRLNRSTAHRTAQTYYVVNQTLREFLSFLGLGFHSAHEKQVPHTILCSPRDVQAAFLRALFDCDGSASGNSTRVVLATASKQLAIQVQLMLLNFGIISACNAQWIETKKRGRTPYYQISLLGQNTVLFAEEIGFSQSHKAIALANSVRRSESRGGKTDVDNIPGGQQLIETLRMEIMAHLPEHTRGRKGEGFWGKIPFKIARLFYDLSRGKPRLGYHHLDIILPAVAKAWPEMENSPVYQKLAFLHSQRYFFDQILQIAHGKANVFDLAIPEVENFTTNGFISHNSQGAEFPVVVLPIITAHYMMLQRNLLYTAITRAKELCVLVGSKKAISMAVRNNKVAERNTALDWRLKQIPPY